MKSKPAETLLEILVAMLLFGIIMAGVANFIANQTTALARLKSQDEKIFQEQKNFYMP